MRTRWIVSLVMAASIGFFAGSGFSEEKEPSLEEMMKEMMRINTPGKHQKQLAAFAGAWDVEETMYTPQGEMKGSGKSTGEMLWNGRYLSYDYKSSYQGAPFEGRGILAFNNVKQKVQNIWMSSWDTGIHVYEGTSSNGGKTLTVHGTHETPWGKHPQRMVWQLSDDGASWTLESWTTKDGKEKKDMLLRFTRASGSSGAAR